MLWCVCGGYRTTTVPPFLRVIFLLLFFAAPRARLVGFGASADSVCISHLAIGTLVPVRSPSLQGFWALKLKFSLLQGNCFITKSSLQSPSLMFTRGNKDTERYSPLAAITSWHSWDLEPWLPGSQQPCPSASPRPPVKRAFPGS